jgi:hypothetical protein
MSKFQALLQQIYNPPIRGRNSKKRRIREKAQKKWESGPLISAFLSDSDRSKLFADLKTDPWHYTSLVTVPVFSEESDV